MADECNRATRSCKLKTVQLLASQSNRRGDQMRLYLLSAILSQYYCGFLMKYIEYNQWLLTIVKRSPNRITDGEQGPRIGQRLSSCQVYANESHTRLLIKIAILAKRLKK